MVQHRQALVTAGARVVVATDAAELEGVDAIVVPGVGAAAPAMAHLRERGLLQPVRDWVRADRPCLGICLGYQPFRAQRGRRRRDAEASGGTTVGLEDAPTLPHIGWNSVELVRPHSLFDGIRRRFALLLCALVRARSEDEEIVVARTTHGRHS